MHRENKLNNIKAILPALRSRLQACDICPRNCRVNRLKGEIGYCGEGNQLSVFTAFLHCGEEPAISGPGGSGTIFFSGCNLKCIYCQNYEFSQLKKGRNTTPEELSEIILGLQKDGADNINLVTPTHFLPQILEALSLTWEAGLEIPVVYNTSGYEKKEIIEQLDGIVDIYLTDLRYLNPDLAKKYSLAESYPQTAERSIKEMYRQYPDCEWQNNLLKKGVIIRQLVLPGYLEESKNIFNWIKENTPKALSSVLFQYRPYFKAKNFPEINRPINKLEYAEIKEFVEGLGIEGWMQDYNPREDLAGVHFGPKKF